MNRKWIAVAAVTAVLALPAVSLAHGGHGHKVMGTVTAVTGSQVEVKGTDGKTVVLNLDAKTVYQHGKMKADAKMLKVGDRVVVSAELPANAKLMTAKIVQMAGTQTSAAAKSAAPAAH